MEAGTLQSEIMNAVRFHPVAYIPFPVAQTAPEDGFDFRKGWGQGGRGKVSLILMAHLRQLRSFII